MLSLPDQFFWQIQNRSEVPWRSVQRIMREVPGKGFVVAA